MFAVYTNGLLPANVSYRQRVFQAAFFIGDTIPAVLGVIAFLGLIPKLAPKSNLSIGLLAGGASFSFVLMIVNLIVCAKKPNIPKFTPPRLTTTFTGTQDPQTETLGQKKETQCKASASASDIKVNDFSDKSGDTLMTDSSQQAAILATRGKLKRPDPQVKPTSNNSSLPTVTLKATVIPMGSIDRVEVAAVSFLESKRKCFLLCKKNDKGEWEALVLADQRSCIEVVDKKIVGLTNMDWKITTFPDKSEVAVSLADGGVKVLVNEVDTGLTAEGRLISMAQLTS